jgi:urea transporter
MKAYLSGWESLCASSRAVRFIDINLRGVGQVMFQDNPLTGALFFAAIVWGSITGGVPQVAIGGAVAVVVATLTAQWLRVDDAALRAGLYGFNGVLVGLALATFIAPGPLLWTYIALGAAVSVVAMSATANALKTLGIPTLTFPFVLVTWLLLLATYGFAGLGSDALPTAGVVAPFEAVASVGLNAGDFLQATLLSVSQVFLKASVVASLLFLAGLAVSSLAAAVAAIGGALLSVVTAHLLGAESDLITGGLLGFSPVLTAVALGTVFHKPGLRVAAYAALGTVFTVIAQAAFNVALTPLAIPALTAPFVLVTWLFLLPKQSFGPATTTQAKDTP